MLVCKTPRLIISGLGKCPGKTFIAIGILDSVKKYLKKTVSFREGLDYIDAYFLNSASNFIGANLDSYLLGDEPIKSIFADCSSNADFALVETDKSIFDLIDYDAACSSLKLSDNLACGFIIVIDCKTISRTELSALKLTNFDDCDFKIEGIILNRVKNDSKLKMIKSTIQNNLKIKILAEIPDYGDIDCFRKDLYPKAVFDKELIRKWIEFAGEKIREHLDILDILILSKNRDAFEYEPIDNKIKLDNIKIGYCFDEAFCFYYQENLEALKCYGAELVKISPLEDNSIPNDIDGLYIGGGYPEDYPERLSQNMPFINDLESKINSGMPVFAECGGLIYLSKFIKKNDTAHFLSGLMDIEMNLAKKIAGYGYVRANVIKENPFFDLNTEIIGHELHYSSITKYDKTSQTCLELTKASPSLNNIDGFLKNNCMGAYIHINSNSCPQWAENFVKSAIKFKYNKGIYDGRQE